jgi:ATPase subunit of ABC transporter with duplicated ATPase domains
MSRPLIGGEGLELSFPTKDVLDGVTLGLAEGQRVGVVGRNGDGKSTLMRVLARRLEPDEGRVTWRRDLRVGFVDQADVLDPTTVVSAAVVGEGPEHEWAGDARIRDVVAGLLGDVPWDARLGDLSGGQRRRVSLAAVLVGDHDVLFLDEPTNHLDVEGVTWLAAHLNTRFAGGQGAFVVVTHDRWFLDEVCTDTWEVHDGVVEPFEGGYAAYVLQRVERDRQAAAAESRRQNLLRKELAWLQREPPVRDSVALQRVAVARLGKDVVDLLDVSVSYGDHEVLSHVEWRLAPGQRVGVLGANGAGKSTLLGLVDGRVAPTRGRVRRGATVRVATLTQALGELDAIADDRVRDVVAARRAGYQVDGNEVTPTQMLERLGFTGAQLSNRVKDLSGGQRRRLQLMLTLLDEPNVLILDEPTNDMDTDMLAAIEDLLDTWPGTLLVVSHDRYLLERVTDDQYAVLDGRLRHLPGGVEEYLRLRRAAEQAETGPAATADLVAVTDAGPATGAAEQRRARKEAARLERLIERLAEREAGLERQMVEAATDPARLVTLSGEHAAVVAEREELEERWLAVAE